MKRIVLGTLLMSIAINAGILTPFEIERKALISIKKTYKHKLRKKCGFSSAYLAQIHTSKEWVEFKLNSQFKHEFDKVCPNGKEILNQNEMNSLYSFVKKYAKDSGNFPKS
jgi:hypothetical protein